jgi:predicted dithiol-disulfide oxidoreductase (DUF899 family)
MADGNLVSAVELAGRSKAAFPNESAAYRDARNALLVEEIELRRKIEQVAAMRRTLPLGGEVPQDFVFEGLQSGKTGTVHLSDLFAGKRTLVIYSYMFGPQKERACPVCTSLLSAWDGAARSVQDRVSLAVTARSPLSRLLEWKRERGWQNLRIFSDMRGDFTRTYVDPEDGDTPGLTVFTKRDGKMYHFWSGEISGEMADPGQDPRGAPDIDPMWTIFDYTPDGRGTTWYPKLEYPELTSIG